MAVIRLRIEESHLDLGEYLGFLDAERPSIETFRRKQRDAFDAERERWRAAGLSESTAVDNLPRARPPELPDDCIAVTSPVSGSVWQIKVEPGQVVEKGATLVIMESMKMEIAVLAESAGTIVSIHQQAGIGASAGDTLLLMRPDANMSLDLTISALSRAYRSGALRPTALVEALLQERAKHRAHNIWISEVEPATLLARARELESLSPDSLPLYGIPFVIKDNIDFAGTADHRRLPGVRLSTRALGARGAGLARCRRHRARQDQSRPVRHRPGGHALALRRVSQCLRSGVHQRRLFERLGRGGGAGSRQLLAGHGHGRLRSRARGVQQSRRLQTHLG